MKTEQFFNHLSLITGKRLARAVFVSVGLAATTLIFSPTLALAPNPQSVGATLELHINADGSARIEGANVLQKAGTTIFVRQDWSASYIRLTVTTDKNTSVTRRFGGRITVADIAPGDFISVTGDFVAGSDALMVKARTIKDWSLQTEPDSFSGTISGVPGGGEITLKTVSGSAISVQTSGAYITKGKITLSPGDLQIGDRVVSASGSYDLPKNILTADRIEIYQDRDIFAPRNFQGILKEISGTELPVVLKIDAEGKIYTVHVPAGASVLNTARQNVSLSRFLKGDAVRFYGAIREANLSEADAKIIRNISL